MPDSVQRSPLARYQRPPVDGPATPAKAPHRVGWLGRNVPAPPTAAQDIQATHEMMVIRLNRAIPAGLAIPSDVIQQPGEMDAAWLAGDVERFRRLCVEYQRRLWNWFRSTPEGRRFTEEKG